MIGARSSALAIDIAGFALLTGAAYLLFFSHRSDYAGHYLAGFGGTLLALSVVTVASREPLGWSAVVVALAAIALGAVTESTVFRLAIEVGTEKHPGIDDVWMVTIDGGRELHLDYEVARTLDEGVELDKPAWSRTIELAAGPDVELTPSRDFWGMLPTVGVLLGCLWLVSRRRTAT